MTENEHPLSGRVALVTGASRGIGHAAALMLARAGAHVVAVARTVGALEELDDQIKQLGGNATLVPLDLKDAAAIDRLGLALFERWGRLDGLLGNAGVLGTMTPLTHLQPKVWDELMAVNITANYRLIRGMDPLLRASDAGRAVFVSSGAARKHLPFWGGYAVTKAALETMVLTYAEECAGTNVKANLFNPGATRTAMRAEAFPGEDPMTLPSPEDVAARLVELLLPDCEQNGELISYRLMRIRAAERSDDDGLWRVLEPVIRAGETYPLPMDMSRDAALAYWFSPEHTVFVAEASGDILGTYYLKPNSRAGGGHVANAGYMTAPQARGQGVATALCRHSFEEAKRRGFRAMQYNLVIASNEAAMHLWPKLGMEIVGRLPGAFHHPLLGYVDAYVMYRTL